ncbi:MAG: succinate dehydrogenase cytochrome b subunit [Pelovirga sp.]
MNLLTNTVGKKILMAVTGLMLIAFITVHLIGNLSVFAGPDSLNAYAKALHDLGPLVWLFRLGMVALFAIHITFGIQLYLENKVATPDPYAIEKTQVTSFSAKTMIFTGLIILAFLLYHLLHFTLQVTNPSISAVNLPLDAASRLDVYSMVVLSFQKVFISLIYIIAMVALLLHLAHGISSWVQTLGWNTGPSQDKVISIGKILAIVYGLAYIAIPLFILARIVK